MGDYTDAQLIVYSCTPEDVPAFTRLIDEYDLRDDWDGDRPPANQIILGHTYCAHDVNVGFINDHLIDAPNSAWFRWNDPLHEYLGDLEMHVPGLGLFKAQCDAMGDAQFTSGRIIKVIEELPEDARRDQVLEAIGDLTGAKWSTALGALSTWESGKDGPTVKAAPRCAWCEELIAKPVDHWVHRETGAEACAEQRLHVAEPDEEPDEE